MENGGNADGFAIKLYPGPGNEFHGCRAWHNSDDGWDLYYTVFPIVVDNCWCLNNGFDKGNANGFKMGGCKQGGTSTGAHVFKNCIAAFHAKKDSTKTIIARVLISSMTSRMATASTMVTTWKSLTMATGCCVTAWALPMAHKRWNVTLLSLRLQTSNIVLGPHSIIPILWVRRQVAMVLPMQKYQ